MKVYLEEKDIGRKITTYHDGFGTRQGLYVYGKDKIEVLSLADYTKQVRKEVVSELMNILNESQYMNRHNSIDKETLFKVLDQIQGETK